MCDLRSWIVRNNIGAYLTKGGSDTDLINRNIAHVEALRQNGATMLEPGVCK